MPSVFISGWLASFSASAQTVLPDDYYVTTGQSGAQTQIDVNHTSTWTLNVGSGFTINFAGANLTMKDGSGSTADLVLSLYSGTVDPANLLIADTFTQSEFDTLHGGLSTSFAPTVLSLPYTLTTGTYLVTLTSPARDVQSEAYFIKGASTSYVLTLSGQAPPSGSVALTSPDGITTGSLSPTTVTTSVTTTDLTSGTYVPTLDGGAVQATTETTTVPLDVTVTSNGGTFDQNGLTTTYSGTISGSGPTTFTNSGTGGSTTLTASNTYTGPTTVDPGATLTLSGSGAIPNSSSVTVDGALNVAPATSPVSLTTLAGSGSVSLGSNSLSLTNGSTTFSGVIGGTGGVTVSGGTQTLAGVNTYTGPTTIDPGATLTLSGSGSIAPSSSVTVNGALNIAPATSSPVSLTTLAGNGTVALGSNSLTLTNASTTFSGVIGGTGGVTISGGTQTFTGANTYTGLTTINSGATLALSGSGSLAGSVQNAGTLDLTGSTATGNQIGGITRKERPVRWSCS